MDWVSVVRFGLRPIALISGIIIIVVILDISVSVIISVIMICFGTKIYPGMMIALVFLLILRLIYNFHDSCECDYRLAFLFHLLTCHIR